MKKFNPALRDAAWAVIENPETTDGTKAKIESRLKKYHEALRLCRQPSTAGRSMRWIKQVRERMSHWALKAHDIEEELWSLVGGKPETERDEC